MLQLLATYSLPRVEDLDLEEGDLNALWNVFVRNLALRDDVVVVEAQCDAAFFVAKLDRVGEDMVEYAFEDLPVHAAVEVVRHAFENFNMEGNVALRDLVLKAHHVLV